MNLTSKEAEELAKELSAKLARGETIEKKEKTIKRLIAGLSDKRGLLRRTFSECLGNIGEAALPDLIDTLLNNKNVIARRAAAKTLKLVGEPKALDSLQTALLNDNDPVVQCSAAGAMAIFGEEAIHSFLKILENKKSTSMQSGLATWGISFAGHKAKETLKKATNSANSSIRYAAIAALESHLQTLDDDELSFIFTKSINDMCPDIQKLTIRLIGKLTKRKWARTILIENLNCEDPVKRKYSALSLIQSNDIRFLEKLIQREKEENDLNVLNIIKIAIKRLNLVQINQRE
tara:strand:+ start:492 stop:1364 length:873 start_codon:yes stop_codon:yes gene_type:complete